MLTFGSLFAGIGGFDLGFERAGIVEAEQWTTNN
jgi:site-specific DNA-cytosine methylase